MPTFARPEVPIPSTADDDPRLGQLIGREPEAPRVVLVGFPVDEGVRRNGGRPGAAAAPTEIRRALYRLTPDARAGAPFIDLLLRTRDLGDLISTGDLEQDQTQLAEVVGGALAAGAFPIVLGGGHETAYGHFLGYVWAKRPVTILNWDAHPDVRALKEGRGHSGSPFLQALLHPSGICQRYDVAGLLPQSCAAAHLALVKKHRGQAIWRDALTAAKIPRLYRARRKDTLVTFDIDAADQSIAPGVSAPATGGLTAAEWLTAAYEAGRCPQVTSCDLVEMNPTHDRDGQTARLAAMTIWNVLRGLAARRPRR